MAKVVGTGYTDTPIAGNPTLTFPRGSVNFTADFRVKSSNGKEVVLTNITSPSDRPEKFRIGYSEVANIFSGSGVEPTISCPSRKGTQLLVQCTEVLSVTDAAAPDYRVDLPVSYHLVIKVPTSEFVTSSVIMTGLGRLLSGVFDTGLSTNARLDAILRGALEPTGM